MPAGLRAIAWLLPPHGAAFVGIGVAAFAAAFAVTFSATSEGGQAQSRAPVGSLAVPFERSGAGLDLSPAASGALPTLGGVEDLPPLAADEAEPARVVIAPTPPVRRPRPASRAANSVATTPPPPPAPAPAPAPEPVAPSPPPAPPPPVPDRAPAPSEPAPEPAPVNFDDSG